MTFDDEYEHNESDEREPSLEINGDAPTARGDHNDITGTEFLNTAMCTSCLAPIEA